MHPHPTQDRRRGAILFMAFIVSMALLLALAAAASQTVTQAKSSRYKLDRSQALALAEGVVQLAQKRILDQVSNFVEIELSGVVTLEGEEHAYDVEPIGDPINQQADDGVRSMAQMYRVTSAVQKGDGYARVEQLINLLQTPMFQYMIFFDGDLEVLPGPSMDIEGRVHTNGDMYVGCGNTLTVDTEYFRATGSIYRKRKNDGSTAKGTVNVKVTGEDTFKNFGTEMDADNPDWTNLAMDTWNGTVQDGSHGVMEVAAPEIGSIKAFNPDGSKGHYHEEADLVIADGRAYDNEGQEIFLPAGIISEKTMYDGREGKHIRVTEVDVEALNSSGYFPENGLLYAFRTDSTSAEPSGVRLSNGAELAAPLTVVTEDPLYIQGDYNTVEKKGAGVIADAVNLLSNAWDDSKKAGQLPSAVDTSYNIAFVTGNVPTPDGGGDYSGGFENLPRFHENWSGKRAKIRGSFINCYSSEIGKSNWEYGGDVYTAPIRDWRYDFDLTNESGVLPPFTPSAYTIDRVYWDDGNPLPFGPGAT